MSDNVLQLASRAFPERLAAMGIVRPSMLRRIVSRLDLRETMCSPSAMSTSGFPDPYRVIDALLGPLRLPLSLPSFKLPAAARDLFGQDSAHRRANWYRPVGGVWPKSFALKSDG